MTDDVRRLPGEWHIEYRYSIGRSAASFFDALVEGRVLGSRCDGCERVSVPPKGFCEYCFRETDDLLDVGPDGVVEAVTVVTSPFKGGPEVPYCVAYVRLDGATSSVANFVRGVALDPAGGPPDSVDVGAPVHVVFREERSGSVLDFWFEPGRLGQDRLDQGA